MNAKLLFKTVFLMLILLLLVMMGMNNKSPVSFALPPILPKAVTQPAALMYFGFFAVGVITGTVLTAGRASGGAGTSVKPSKSGK